MWIRRKGEGPTSGVIWETHDSLEFGEETGSSLFDGVRVLLFESKVKADFYLLLVFHIHIKIIKFGKD